METQFTSKDKNKIQKAIRKKYKKELVAMRGWCNTGKGFPGNASSGWLCER